MTSSGHIDRIEDLLECSVTPWSRAGHTMGHGHLQDALQVDCCHAPSSLTYILVNLPIPNLLLLFDFSYSMDVLFIIISKMTILAEF